jgi:hypothetical protein
MLSACNENDILSGTSQLRTKVPARATRSENYNPHRRPSEHTVLTRRKGVAVCCGPRFKSRYARRPRRSRRVGVEGADADHERDGAAVGVNQTYRRREREYRNERPAGRTVCRYLRRRAEM